MAPSDASLSPSMPPLVNALVNTLEEEVDALLALAKHTELQLEAIGNQEGDAFDTHQQMADAALHRLEQLRRVRKRNVEKLGGLLGKEGESLSVDAIATILDQHAGGRDAARALRTLHERVVQHAASIREQCNLIDSCLHVALALRADMDKTIEQASLRHRADIPSVAA